MPFVTIQDIKPFISTPMFNVLNKDNNFEVIEREASLIIRDNFDINIPSIVAESPEAIKYPAAMIIQKLSKRLLTEISPEFNSSIEQDYKSAFMLLENIAPRIKQKSIIAIGKFEGIEEW